MKDEIKKGDLVHIVWLDSDCAHGWSRLDDVEGTKLNVYSIGKVVEIDDSYLVISGHWTKEKRPQHNGRMTIPRRAIIGLYKIDPLQNTKAILRKED